jgi:hypothetical protein
MELQIALDSSSLDLIYADNDNVRSAFAGDLEALASGHFSSEHTDIAGLQTAESSLQVQISADRLIAVGDLVVGVFDGDALGDGFESMRFEIIIGDVDQYTVVSKEFYDEAAAEAYFKDNSLNLGSSSNYIDGIGNITVTVRVTTTSSSEGAGFTGSIVLGDVGGSAPADARAFQTASSESSWTANLHTLDLQTIAAVSDVLFG